MLIPEFVGRLPVIATLEDLDESSLKLILTQPKNALVKQYQRLFEMEGVDLTATNNSGSSLPACSQSEMRSTGWRQAGDSSAPRLCSAYRGYEFNLHEDQVLITAIDDVVLYSGGPEICYASGKLGG